MELASLTLGVLTARPYTHRLSVGNLLMTPAVDVTISQDPDEFIPDRFMEGTPESKAVIPDAWVPFGGGVRACVGEKFAMAVSTLSISPPLISHKSVL